MTFDARLPKVQFFGELMDSRGVLNDEQSSVGTFLVNTFEPIQTYAAWTRPDVLQDGANSTLRVGRLTLDIGKRRLVSRNRYRNTVSTFTGVDWEWRGAGGQNARAIYLIPMLILPTSPDELLDDEFELDRGARDTTLWGGFYQFPKGSHGDTAEVYGFSYDSAGAAAAPVTFFDIWSVGSRVFRAPAKGRWNYEVEVVAQIGESGGVVARHAAARPRPSGSLASTPSSATNSTPRGRRTCCSSTTTRAATRIRSTAATSASTRCSATDDSS